MKCINFVLLCLSIAGCKPKNDIVSGAVTPIISIPECEQGKMELINIATGTIERAPILDYGNGPDSLLIVVSPAFKTSNFISDEELFFRQESQVLTIEEHSLSGFIRDQKDQAKEFEKQKILSMNLADSIHFENNKGQQEIWIVNKSNKNITIPCSDGTPVAILQALDKGHKWQPVNYYWFNWCGNSYYYLFFKPDEALRFIANIPNEGSFKTKFRFKMLGYKTFYYSNTFDGVIDYCQFSDQGINTDCINCKPAPENRLEVLPKGWWP